MNGFKRLRRVLFVGALIVAAGAPAFGQGALQGMPHKTMPDTSPSLGAHGRYSKATINLQPAQYPLLVALVDAGGGGTAFDADKLISSLTGSSALTHTEIAALNKKFGAPNVASFAKVFSFVISDSLAQVSQAGIALPPAQSPADAKALTDALYAAGLTPRGSYDVEYMLDSLLSHIIHVQVMNDIDADPDLGADADANYHLVLAQLLADMKKAATS